MMTMTAFDSAIARCIGDNGYDEVLLSKASVSCADLWLCIYLARNGWSDECILRAEKEKY